MLKRVVFRWARATLTQVAAQVAAWYLNDPRFAWIGPILQAAGKAARLRWPQTGKWFPF